MPQVLVDGRRRNVIPKSVPYKFLEFRGIDVLKTLGPDGVQKGVQRHAIGCFGLRRSWRIAAIQESVDEVVPGQVAPHSLRVLKPLF